MGSYIIPIDPSVITEITYTLNGYITSANNITIKSTFTQIRKAQDYLCMAKGLFEAIKRLRTIPTTMYIEEEIQRIDTKILYILEEKSRERIRKWRA